MPLTATPTPEFGLNWSVLSALAARRAQQESTQNFNNVLMQQPAPQPTPDPEPKVENGSGLADLVIPNLLSMMGLHLLGEMMHLESAIEEMKDAEVEWKPIPQQDPRVLLGPAWFLRAPQVSSIHQNLNKPIEKPKSYGKMSFRGKV